MPEKVVGDVYKQYGLLGLIVLLLGAVIIYIIWDRFQDVKEAKKLEDKKRSGDYVSFDDVKELKETMKNHLASEATEDARFTKIENQLMALQEKVNSENGHLFKQHGTLFEKIDKLDEKIMANADTLSRKIDDRFLVINEDIKEILKQMRK